MSDIGLPRNMSRDDAYVQGMADAEELAAKNDRRYNIVRFYKRSYRRMIIRKQVTLEEAQAHCKDPETSSSTAKSPAARRRTKLVGDWFDGYEER